MHLCNLLLIPLYLPWRPVPSQNEWVQMVLQFAHPPLPQNCRLPYVQLLSPHTEEVWSHPGQMKLRYINHTKKKRKQHRHQLLRLKIFTFKHISNLLLIKCHSSFITFNMPEKAYIWDYKNIQFNVYEINATLQNDTKPLWCQNMSEIWFMTETLFTKKTKPKKSVWEKV